MFAALPPSFLLILLAAMIGIPLYLLAQGGLGGPDLSSFMKATDDDDDDGEDDKQDGEKKDDKKKKKRPHDDPGSPLDIGDLGGLAGLVGLSALVILAFTMFPQELNGIMNSVSGGLDFTPYKPWGKGDTGVPSYDKGGVPLAKQSPPPVAVFPGKKDRVRMKPSFNTVSRHLRILRAQPVLLVGYNEDHMGSLIALLGTAAVLPAAYIFGQMIWDSQYSARRQARQDLADKIEEEDMKKAAMYEKRAELFDADAKRIRQDKINMLEDIKSKPPWWNGDLSTWKERETYRRREETNTLAQRASRKAKLFRLRKKELDEKWKPTESTRGGQTEKEDNLFPGIPLLTYMRQRSRGAGTRKTALDPGGLLESYKEPAQLMMDTEDFTTRSKFNSEGGKKHPNQKLQYQKGLRGKMYGKWWEEDRDEYGLWSRDEKLIAEEQAERKKKERAQRVFLEADIRKKLMLGTEPGKEKEGDDSDSTDEGETFSSKVPSRQAVAPSALPAAKHAKEGGAGNNFSSKAKRFFKGILP